MKNEAFLRRVRRLQWKYRTLVDLKNEREAAEAEGRSEFTGEELARRTRRFREVSEEFPGSLRELELVPPGILQSRLEEAGRAAGLGTVDSSGSCRRGHWMAVVMDYHRLLRQRLATKRWLSGLPEEERLVTPELVSRFHHWRVSPALAGLFDPEPATGEPGAAQDRGRSPDPAGSAAYLEEVLRPPGGRLHSLVWRELEVRHGLSRDDLEYLVFGSSSASP